MTVFKRLFKNTDNQTTPTLSFSGSCFRNKNSNQLIMSINSNITFPFLREGLKFRRRGKNILDIFIFLTVHGGEGRRSCFKKCSRSDSSPEHPGWIRHTFTRMLWKERMFADKKWFGGLTHPHTGSTGSAAGSLEDSCTCIHPPDFGSHADTCGFHHTRPYLSETNTQQTTVTTFILYRLILTSLVFQTFAALSVGIQWESSLAVAVEAPRRVLAGAIGATHAGVRGTFVVVYAERRKSSDECRHQSW